MSVLGRDTRIQYLKLISPTGRARKNAVRIFFLKRWRRRRGTGVHTSSESFLLRLRHGQARDCHHNSKHHELLHSFFSGYGPASSCRLDSSGAELSREMDYLEKARRVFDVEILELQRLRQRLGDDFSRPVPLIKPPVASPAQVAVLALGPP